MQPSNHQHAAPIHGSPATAQPAELPAPSESPAASPGAPAPTNGAKRASAFAIAWNNLRSAPWVKRTADSAIVRGVLSTLRKALDDTQAGSQHDDKKQP
jgi:hypothetical protein